MCTEVMLKVKSRQTTKREFGRTHVTQIIGKFGTGQFSNGKFGTKRKKQTIQHKDNLAPDNLAQFIELVLPTI